MRLFPLIFLVAVLSCNQAAKKNTSYTLRVKGSESLFKTFEALKSDYESAQDTVTIVLDGGGSRTGLMAIRDKEADIGLSSFSFDLDQELGVDHKVKTRVVAYDGIVVINHERNGINQLTKAQLARIYSGEISDWSQLGGTSGSIKPVVRDSNSGTQRLFSGYVGLNEMTSNAVVAETNREILEHIWEDPNGIGFIGLSYYAIGVKDVFLPSEHTDTFISPTHKNIQNGSYPLRRELLVYHNPGNPAVDSFLSYLDQPRAKKVIEDMGLIAFTE